MTSSHGNISALLALCAGNSPVTGEFPSQRPVMRGFDVFFDLRLNKRSGQFPSQRPVMQGFDVFFDLRLNKRSRKQR